MGLEDLTSEKELNQLWDEFLEKWPVETLKNLTLEQYTRAGAGESFTYWLESKSDGIGSVWGGSSFKFGIFNRADKKYSANAKGRCYTDDYGWYQKYGKTPEVAFETIRKNIETIAKAAREGELKAIDKVDLGTAIKWKIAFLYQDRKAPEILPVFKESNLKAYLGVSGRFAMSDLYSKVLSRREDEELFSYARKVWKVSSDKLNAGVFTAERAREYLEERLEAFSNPGKKLAGFVTDPGKELALLLHSKPVTLFLAPGPWAREGVRLIKEFDAGKRPHDELKSQAPSLALGPACSVEVRSRSALVALCDAYEGREVEARQFAEGEIPLNQILYGPPGTGKTFHSITKALEILDPDFLKTNSNDRALLKSRFDELHQQGRVRIVTFHQSFSYEDFVEGISAIADTGDKSALKYGVEPGVFAEICGAAELSGMNSVSAVSPNSRVWKISIGRRHEDVELREECFRRGEARIGWGAVGNMADPERSQAEIARLEGESAKNRNSLSNFHEGVSVGDILLCLGTSKTIQAVGIVTGDYEYDKEIPESFGTYFHKRSVKWLATGLDADILKLNQGRSLTQQTIYELPRIGAPEALRLANLPEKRAGGPEPYVLIIDEINRGNVARVFGELITLLEPSKRAGASEALRVSLPYSGKLFSIPQNLYVIGTMNTADRSLATLDIALRRRFEFIEMAPDPEELEGVRVDGIDVAELLAVINQRIEVLLDRDHALGHAYFLPLKANATLAQLAAIFRTRVLPLLQEYFFEDWEHIRWVLNDHRKKILAHQFVIQPAYDVRKLLGDGPGIPVQSRNWRVNPDAFSIADSFRGIIQAE